MTRYEEAERLYAEGWTYQQIAERWHGGEGLSVSALRSRGKRYVDHEQSLVEAREWKARNREHVRAYDARYAREHRGVCEDCGGPMGLHNPRDGVCRSCRGLRRERNWRAIQLMWEDGLLLREIAEALGWSRGYLAMETHRLRKAGWSLPYRRRTMRGKVLV